MLGVNGRCRNAEISSDSIGMIEPIFSLFRGDIYQIL